MVPVIFFAKRLLLASILIVANDFLWVQLAILNFMALCSLILTLSYNLMESKKANVLEAFNDCTLLVLTYHLWCYTEFVGEVETRYELGYSYIGFFFGNIIVHSVSL